MWRGPWLWGGVFFLLTACAAVNTDGARWRPTVAVDNGSRSPVHLFVLVDGELNDLGVVPPASRARLSLPPSVVGAVVQFAVRPEEGTERKFLQPIFRFRAGMEFLLHLLPENVPVVARTIQG